ncbi:ComEA family DNA-binding protein [Deinococcus petrolearius]|uniref:ComEA family DNA-binding protein n=1 Tax=Deinococcus petrolearius TaxID=1751295 RepID=A0ABW1DRF2_9DEIO
MRPAERSWTLALALGTLAVAGLTLGPALWPRPHAPQVMRAELAPVSAPDAGAEPPTYATTAGVRPLISGRVNLNTATEEQLEALPRIGPALAARLVAARPYRSLADLDRVRGVGPSTLRVLAPLVSFR